jgi:hypothetical protein
MKRDGTVTTSATGSADSRARSSASTSAVPLHPMRSTQWIDGVRIWYIVGTPRRRASATISPASSRRPEIITTSGRPRSIAVAVASTSRPDAADSTSDSTPRRARPASKAS